MINRDLTNELEYYLKMDGSEIDDLWEALIAVSRRDECYLSEGFAESVEQEIREQLQNIKNNAKEVTEEYTTTTTIKRLEWL